MKLTTQQSLVLFDIAKSAMNHREEGFAGYSRKEIMKLINDIISQQDNIELISTEDVNPPKSHNITPGNLYEVGKVEDSEIVKLKHDEGLQGVTHEVLKKMSKDEEDFWNEN